MHARYIRVLYSLFPFCLLLHGTYNFVSSIPYTSIQELQFRSIFRVLLCVWSGMGLPRDGCGHGWRVWLIKGGCGDGCGDWRMWAMPMVRDGRGQE